MTDSPPIRINLLTLGVTDLDRAASFYEAMGLVPSAASQAGIRFYQAGPLVIALFGRDELAADAGLPAGPSGFRACSLAWNHSDEAAVDDAYRRAVAAGAAEVKPPHRTDWGGYSSYVQDPDGHLWEFAHNPFFPFDDLGALRLP